MTQFSNPWCYINFIHSIVPHYWENEQAGFLLMVVGTRVDMGRTYRTGSFLSLTSEDSQVGTAYWRWMVAYLHYRGEELNRHDTKHVLQQHYSDSMHRYPECPIHPCAFYGVIIWSMLCSKYCTTFMFLPSTAAGNSALFQQSMDLMKEKASSIGL